MRWLLVLSFLAFLAPVSSASADSTIGSCRFKGPKPKKGTSFGSMTTYHDGDLRKTGTRGRKSIYKSKGNVWVIFSRFHFHNIGIIVWRRRLVALRVNDTGIIGFLGYHADLGGAHHLLSTSALRAQSHSETDPSLALNCIRDGQNVVLLARQYVQYFRLPLEPLTV